VNASSAYLVGEQGPEILTGVSGRIANTSASQRMLGELGRIEPLLHDRRPRHGPCTDRAADAPGDSGSEPAVDDYLDPGDQRADKAAAASEIDHELPITAGRSSRCRPRLPLVTSSSRTERRRQRRVAVYRPGADPRLERLLDGSVAHNAADATRDRPALDRLPRRLQGPACVFQLPTFLAAFVPSGAVPGTYWRLKENTAKWSINPGFIVGMQFDIREAI
jgi:hypothetical protein